MGPASAKNVINLEEVDDEVLDESTTRWWRRRCIANGIYKLDRGSSVRINVGKISLSIYASV